MSNDPGRRYRLEAVRTRIARQVFRYCESEGLADRELLERITDRVIHYMEKSQLSLPGIEVASAIPEWRLKPSEIQAVVKTILAEGSDMKVAEERKNEIQKDAGIDGESKPTIAKKSPSRKSVPGRPATVDADLSTFSTNAMRVLEKRYLKTDEQFQAIETPFDLFRRVAQNIASAEQIYNPSADPGHWEDQFYRIMANLEFLPNSPTLMNAGRELQQLSACFVLPVGDSMESIFDTIKNTALIHKSGGGTGFAFSRLRPAGDMVGSTGKVASGPVSFMRVFDAATDVIKQGGMRRGANMAILNVDHPDIMEFITAKESGNRLANFNLSVAVTDSFMAAIESGGDYELRNPRDGSPQKSLNAREVFDKIVDMAWRTGDPGLVFIDRINSKNPTPQLGTIESTNPCGEQPLLPYESCNLGSINLARMVAKSDDGRYEIDYDRLADTVNIAVRFLDNVIDKNRFPLSEIENMTKKTRKIGLGVMGFADMLIKLCIPYDSPEALATGEKVMRYVNDVAVAASGALAEERGVFPAFEGSDHEVLGRRRVRNATVTTIAPTGTLSIIAGCSSGIEPLFALSYVRHILDGDELLEVNPYFEEVARGEGFYSTDLMKELATRGSIRAMDGAVPEWVKKVFVTAHDIGPEWHVKMQAAFQRSTHNAVSKTINFPHTATREDVSRAYTLAYQLGCKGITIYRDRSKDAQVLNIPAETETQESRLEPRKRPRVTRGITEKVTTGCGSIYVTVNFDEYGICEVFSSLGKAGGCASAQLEAISRLISLALRSGMDVAAIVKHIRGIRCPSIAWDQGHAILSCPDAIASVLERQINGNITDESKRTTSPAVAVQLGGQCPECGGMLVYQEGCQICHGCGYTKCG